MKFVVHIVVNITTVKHGMGNTVVPASAMVYRHVLAKPEYITNHTSALFNLQVFQLSKAN